MADPVTKKIDTLADLSGIAAANDKMVVIDASDTNAVTKTKLVAMNQLYISLPAQVAASVVENATIADDAVQTTKIKDYNVTFEKLERPTVGPVVLGRAAATATNPIAEIRPPAASNTVLTATETTVGFGKITTSHFDNMSARTVLGNATNASAPVTAIAANTDGYVLRRSGDTIGFGKVKAAGIDSMTSAQLKAIVSDETGSGALVFGTSPTIGTATLNSPTLVTPELGTPASGTLTNCTGLKHVVYMQLFLPDEAIVGSTTARTQFFVPYYLAGGVVKQLGIGVVASSTGKTVGVALGSTYGSVSGVTSTETADTLSYTLPSALTKIPITVSCTTGDPAPKGLDFWFVVLK